MKPHIPPVVQLAVCAGLAWGLSEWLPGFAFAWPFSFELAVIVAAMGIVVPVAAVVAFIRAKTTVNPIDPSQARSLVTTGFYRVSRNPMYLGMALLLVAQAIYLSNAAALVSPLVFVIAMTHLQIKPEEAALKRNFGEAYRAYRQRTRRWI